MPSVLRLKLQRKMPLGLFPSGIVFICEFNVFFSVSFVFSVFHKTKNFASLSLCV